MTDVSDWIVQVFGQPFCRPSGLSRLSQLSDSGNAVVEAALDQVMRQGCVPASQRDNGRKPLPFSSATQEPVQDFQSVGIPRDR